MKNPWPMFCVMAWFAVAALAIDVRADVITPVFPSSQGQPVDLDAPNEGFVKVGSFASDLSVQTNTSSVLSNIAPVGAINPGAEFGNSANYFLFQSTNQGIDDNQGINTGYGGSVDNTGNGFSFTVANNPLSQTLNVYVGEFASESQLTVTNGSNVILGTDTQSASANLYLDEVVSLPANSGLTTISWVQQASNGGFNNPSIFAVTAATAAPEPGTCLTLASGAAGLLLAAYRRSMR